MLYLIPYTHTGPLVAQYGSNTYSVKTLTLHTYYDVRRHQYQEAEGTVHMSVGLVKQDCSSNAVSPTIPPSSPPKSSFYPLI